MTLSLSVLSHLIIFVISRRATAALDSTSFVNVRFGNRFANKYVKMGEKNRESEVDFCKDAEKKDRGNGEKKEEVDLKYKALSH